MAVFNPLAWKVECCLWPVAPLQQGCCDTISKTISKVTIRTSFTGVSMSGQNQCQWAKTESQFKTFAIKAVLDQARPAASVAGAIQPASSAPSIPVLSASEVHSQLALQQHANTANYLAFYSSVVGGITRDPTAMLIPMDDHMVHRGHGVFDTALVWEGYMYELDAHLDRILRSAAKAKIKPPYPREELRRIIIETAAVSGMRRGHMRFWLSVGPGGFSLSTTECKTPTFYAMAIGGKTLGQPTEGVKVITSSVPIKPPEFASTKSVNYLPNAMVLWEAEQHGAAAGIWLDQQGCIAEGQSMNCAFVSQEGVLLVPDFEPILEGCTMKRVMVLAKQLMDESSDGVAPGGNGSSSSVGATLTGIRMGQISVEEARAAKEMMLCGSGVMVEPVVQWDDEVIGTGKPGAITMALRKLLEDDLTFSPDPQRIKIEYHQ